MKASKIYYWFLGTSVPATAAHFYDDGVIGAAAHFYDDGVIGAYALYYDV